MRTRLQISGLSKTYGNGVCALRDVTLDVPTGMFGLLGPNGAGKSTLMRTVATLQPPDRGAITFDDIDVLRDRDGLRRVLGYLPQDFGVYPRATPESLLDHLALLKGIARRDERRSAVEALLRRTNLWDARKRRLGTFSGGMRQRFGIAQALIGDPKLVIVDEPTAGLDPDERMRFLNLLAALSEDIVVILSTHLVDDVAELCTHLAIISGGEVLRMGRPDDTIAAIEGRVWGALVPRDDLSAVTGRMEVLSTRLRRGDTVVHVYSDEPPGEGFEPVRPELEHVYFHTLRQHSEQPVAA